MRRSSTAKRRGRRFGASPPNWWELHSFRGGSERCRGVARGPHRARASAASRALARARWGGYWPRMRLDWLREQLGGYRPASATEAAFVQRMLELSQGERAWERSEFGPGH